MNYQLFIEGREVEIDTKLGIQLTLAIDDISKFSSRNTSFSKTLVIPGTKVNNAIFGHIHELGSANEYSPGSTNIGVNFNVAQTSRAELRMNGLLLMKGVFRLTGIVKVKNFIEYEGSIFGELGGFMAAIGNGKLEDLNFAEYNHEYNTTNITDSWDAAFGSGYYYPLIDHGNYSDSNKVDYQVGTFRPALFVREYLDKIFNSANYTFESDFFDSDFFQKLIIPCNVAKLQRYASNFISGYLTAAAYDSDIDPDNAVDVDINYTDEYLTGFTKISGQVYRYTGTNTTARIQFAMKGSYTFQECNPTKPNVLIQVNCPSNNKSFQYNAVQTGLCGGLDKQWDTTGGTFDVSFDEIWELNTNDDLTVTVFIEKAACTIDESTIKVTATVPTLVDVVVGDDIVINDYIPKNIFQKDFFSWILKMFNLYVDEDKLNDKKLIIKPYKDYYQSEGIDWTYKIARDKAWNISPMGLLNGRFFEFKFKEDNDYFNENYKKKYNQSYGDRLEDTGFQFAKDKQTNEIGFSPTVLVQYGETDKVVPAIYKKSGENEDRMDSNIRILLAKKITGVAEWDILDGVTVLENNLTVYGYAGHFDDPADPTVDINFGAANEIYFTPNSYTPNNLFNVYWSGYISEIADKDSKVLKAYVYLTPFDIAKMDFSVPVIIDGVLWRVNKIEDFDMNELTKVELLKVINNG